MSNPRPYTLYFGGELFSGKHLFDNAALSEAIFHRSEGKYVPVLPQNLEQRGVTAHSIRDQDILALLDCDPGDPVEALRHRELLLGARHQRWP